MSVTFFPEQILVLLPAMEGFGSGFTVSPVVAALVPQEFVTEYLTVTTPAPVPVATPPGLVIVAEPGPLKIDQTPPEVASVKGIVDAPLQTVAAPPFMFCTLGNGFTAIVSDLAAPLQLPIDGITDIVPVDDQLMVMQFVPCAEAITLPPVTDQLYVTPAVLATQYVCAVPAQILVDGEIALGCAGGEITVTDTFNLIALSQPPAKVWVA